MIIRAWAQSHIQHRIAAPPLRFTATGPYQLVRNPLYIGNTLVILGATVFSGLLWLVPIALGWCVVVFSLVVRHEESQLPQVFGDEYCRYRQLVPRWVPRWRDVTHIHFGEQLSPRALFAELHCFLVLVPFLVKELILSTSWHSLWSTLRAQL
jgi:hypothetical protein